MSAPRIAVNSKDKVMLVELLDENILKLDEGAVIEITEELFTVVMENAPVRMVLNFGRVKYLGSCMLGTLIRLSKRIADSGGELKLCSIHPAIFKMFMLVKLDRIFDIYQDEEAALGSFGS